MSIISEPVEMFFVAALGLVIAGFLFRIAMKIAGARRRRIIVDRAESHWLDDPNGHELRDEQQHESARQWDELIDEFIQRPQSDWIKRRKLRDDEKPSGFGHPGAPIIDDLQGAVTLTPDDDTADRLSRNDYELQEKPQRRDREPNIADEIAKREDRLEQLKRDLDRLLRSPRWRSRFKVNIRLGHHQLT